MSKKIPLYPSCRLDCIVLSGLPQVVTRGKQIHHLQPIPCLFCLLDFENNFSVLHQDFWHIFLLDCYQLSRSMTKYLLLNFLKKELITCWAFLISSTSGESLIIWHVADRLLTAHPLSRYFFHECDLISHLVKCISEYTLQSIPVTFIRVTQLVTLCLLNVMLYTFNNWNGFNSTKKIWPVLTRWKGRVLFHRFHFHFWKLNFGFLFLHYPVASLVNMSYSSLAHWLFSVPRSTKRPWFYNEAYLWLSREWFNS